jgi:hypothetical protein
MCGAAAGVWAKAAVEANETAKASRIGKARMKCPRRWN